MSHTKHESAVEGGGAGHAQLFPMRLLGFGLLLAWGAAIASFEQAIDVASLSSPVLRLWVSSGLAALCYLVLAWRARRSGSGMQSSAPLLAALATAATLCPALSLMGAMLEAFPLDLMALVFKAVSTAGLFLLWSARLATHRPRVAWVAYAGSLALAASVWALLHLAGTTAVFVGAFALPAASTALLKISAGLPRDDAPDTTEPAVWRVPWRPVLLVAVFSFAQQLVGHYDGSVLNAYEWGRLVASVTVLVPLLVRFDRFDVEMLARACPVLMVGALVICGLHGFDDTWGAKKLLASAGYYLFTLYLYLMLNTLSFRFGIRAEWLFGCVLAADALITPAGAMAGNWAHELAGQGAYLVVDIASGCVTVVLVLACMLLVTGRSLSDAWGIRGTRLSSAPGAGMATGKPEGVSATSDYVRDRMRLCENAARRYGLTHREEEVLALLLEGKTFQQIEAALCIAHGTMRTHVQHVYAKLGAHSGDEVREVVSRK